MEAIKLYETELGFLPLDVCNEKLGWDIESRDEINDEVRYIEVKERIQGASSIIVSRNEIIQASI